MRNLRSSGKCLLIHPDSKQEGESKPKSTLSKEEKLQKAKELQDAIRKKRAIDEKKLAEEQEKNRIRITKELSEAKRKMEEQQ